MEPLILLGQLRALSERAPDFDNWSATSREHMVWLSQLYALIKAKNEIESFIVKSSIDNLSNRAARQRHLAIIFGTLHRAIAELELIFPAGVEVEFGAGNVYDFFAALNKVISSAESSIFIIDPYLDHSVFDHYLNSRKPQVNARLLLSHKPKDIVPSAEKYTAQYGNVLEVRESQKLHDRVIFIDGNICWVVGQSIKDAAKAKPTYLVQLPPDVVPQKIANYESIWAQANVL